MGVIEVDYSISRTSKRIGIGRVLNGKRLLQLIEAGGKAA